MSRSCVHRLGASSRSWMLSRATATRWRPMSDEMLCASGWRRRSRRALGRCGRRAIVRAGVGRAWRTAAAVLAWRRPDLARELVVNEAGPLLASRHGLRVLALDAPGFGRSPPSARSGVGLRRARLAVRTGLAGSMRTFLGLARHCSACEASALERSGRGGGPRPGGSKAARSSPLFRRGSLPLSSTEWRRRSPR
jgi:hypothetical protein